MEADALHSPDEVAYKKHHAKSVKHEDGKESPVIVVTDSALNLQVQPC